MRTVDIFKLKNEVVSGKNVNLRIARPSDAEFILTLRLDPKLNKFIGQTDPSVENQRKWIESTYRKANDFHFIIEDKSGNSYGTVAVYEIDYGSAEAVWGRWIIKQGSFVFFPVESTILVLYFAFVKLGLKKLTGGANNKNISVVNFHKTYATVLHVDENHTWFVFEQGNFLKLLKMFEKFHDIRI